MCHRVAVLHKGKVLAYDSPSRLKATHAPARIVELLVRDYTTRIGTGVQQQCHLTELLEHFEDIATGQARLRPKWSDGGDPAQVVAALTAAGVQVLGSEDVKPTLSDVYFELSREKLS